LPTFSINIQLAILINLAKKFDVALKGGGNWQ